MVLEPSMLPEGMAKSEFFKLMELPGKLFVYALMYAKNRAATGLVFITLVNYILYRLAIRKGRIVWGKINPHLPICAGLFGLFRNMAHGFDGSYQIIGAQKLSCLQGF